LDVQPHVITRRREFLNEKRMLSLLIFVLMLSLTSAVVAAQTITIGWSQYTQKSPFYTELIRTAKLEAENNNVRLIVLDAMDDIVKQTADVEDLIARGVDVLVVNPKDPKAILVAVEQANRAGIPVIVADSGIDASAKVAAQIRANNFEIGFLTGEHIAKTVGAETNMVIISGTIESIAGMERRNGMIAGFYDYALKTYGKADLNVLVEGWGAWTKQGGVEAMEPILVAHKDIDVVFAVNDSMALGALQAIEEAGREGEILVAAIDGEKQAYDLIKEGRYLASGLNNPTILGQETIKLALQVFNGEDVDPIQYTPVDVVTKDNVDKYYDPASEF